ncbi:ArsR/SmtB family transcription factor [Actinocrispum wychmicini]|uniref:ArsR/SmtB family transcription factor n=1 Tax=Actinocrispum wychmicini TaxID=1213861 RepID=UPI00104F6AF6|nr:winged helix-turn-helix domain-containing protein [Actinocrispum wychmicini]
MLIHFTREDLARTRISGSPDSLWELVLSLHRLQRPRPTASPGPLAPADVLRWRANTLTGLSGHALGRRVRDHLLPLTPISSYFPDFLTPHTGLQGLEPGLDTLLATPRSRIGRELDELTTRSGAPSWGSDLATGDAQALHLLGNTIRDYFTTTLAPTWPTIQAQATTEHTRLTGILATHGIDAMLANLLPTTTWHPSDQVLEFPYPMTHTVHLHGRGLTLIPSWFCSPMPVVLVDLALPPVLVYPLTHTPPPATDPHALAKLIGPTRAKILLAITTATPTRAIQHRTGISASQLSRHAAVLRDNNLITEARHAGHTFYTRTPLGHTLTNGQQTTA